MFHHDKFRVFFCGLFVFFIYLLQRQQIKLIEAQILCVFLVKLSHYKSLRQKLVVLPPSATNSSIRVQKPRGMMNIARVAFNI